jgi:hypothetical protein
MLREAEFVAQQRTLGCRIHEHDGVFWEEIQPFYCKPAFIHKPFDPEEAKPPWRHSLFGYDHQVRHFEKANRTRFAMVLSRAVLDGYGLNRLPSKKRNQVRRGLEHCAIRPLVDVEANLERMREINVSQAIRQEKGSGSETPVHRYLAAADEWRRQMRCEFALNGREWWGAYVDGTLAAYLRTYQVDGIRLIKQTKADTAFLKFYPMDALYFSVLSAAAADPACLRVINSHPMHPSLNHFKEAFLFAPEAIPCYYARAGLAEAGKKLLLAMKRRRRRHQSRQAETAGEG